MNGVIGVVMCFTGSYVPRDWASCDGQILLISEHPLLFKILGTAYGGNGVTTFCLPDLRGRTALSAGQAPFHNYELGASAGNTSVILLPSNMPAHTHNGVIQLKLPAFEDDGIDPTVNEGYPSPFPGAYAASGERDMAEPHYEVVDNGNTSAGKPIPTRSPFLVLTYIICLKGIFPSRS